MRNGTGPLTAPPVDESLRARRRAMETAGGVSRSVGFILITLYMTGVTGLGPAQLSDAMLAASWLSLALIAAADVLAVLARRRPESRWYPLLSAVQVLFDTITIVAFVVVSERDFTQTTWPLLALAISIAAIRHQLPGAILTFLITSVAFVLLVPDSPDLAFVVGTNAMTTIMAGAQSSAFSRQFRELNETRRALQHQATHDPLTGLPNRARLAAYAQECEGLPLVVLLLDLNGFKEVNDTHGHAAGDVLLHEIGARLGVVVGGDGLVGRLGGDEFLVLLPGAGAEAAGPAVDRIRAAIRQPIDIGGHLVTVGVSAGSALRPAGARTGLDTLTAEADAAMYRDKRDRRRRAA
ncbi:GGDEF domain-containing protein [Actinoplanes couchii]|uniref:GGDEF domain-containing protein n=1 Tax=Actinoplanes couchii TaxID=403638 RepID=UPI001942A18B|nr:GGDEF domain-containing protein [Actinoplanes couchii]MDR6321380.1 diguanylate cyclase (GGDEF)-like protein [Actinoplanes couchii]